MIRKIIKIDKEKCNGCGACASACHEGAIEMIDQKATLTREDYCDGLGDCLPVCPTDAISFEEREAPAYNEAAVLASKKKAAPGTVSCSCSDSALMPRSGSALMQWPVQIKLLPTRAPYYEDADLLIAADCTAYAYGNFHQEFIRDHITLIGCPKLDDGDYTEKLTEIIKNNNIRSITVVRMVVPCCGGIEYAAKRALQISGKSIPCSVISISTDGSKLL